MLKSPQSPLAASLELVLMLHLFIAPLVHRAELGHFLHPCEGDLVCRCTNEKIPYFNAPVYLENKSQIGKVDDIFGPMNEFVSHTARLHKM